MGFARVVGRILAPTVPLLALTGGGIAAQSVPQTTPPLSPRNANYAIEVTLDAAARTLRGTQLVEWRNIQEQPTDELWFHLYWNAWRNDRSTWMLENRLGKRSDLDQTDIREEDWGWLEIDAVRLLDADGDPLDISAARRYAAPDDGNPDDRTVMVVTLPAAVSAAETVRVEIDWRAKIPRTFARTGYRGNYFFIAHWFPKLGVYEANGWNCHQYHSSTEYFSDYGVYDVRMTVPSGWIVGATGIEVEQRDNDDGTTTHRYYQEDVHAFTWTTSRDYLEQAERFFEPGLPAVEMRLLIQPEHLSQAKRHFDATRAALKHYGLWYGAYPYDHVTVVDPAWGSGAGGMEYPTLFTAGTRLFNPFGSGSPEGVTVHEMGHQFWYGLVGNNEFEHAWIDEGLNTFSTNRTKQEVWGDSFLVRRYLPPPGESESRRGFIPVAFRGIRINSFVNRLDRLRPYLTSNEPHTPTYQYHPRTGYNITYSKTALWLLTLERHLGWDTLQGILSTFFERYRFRHPTPDDFFAVADEVAGQPLGWFFDQVFFDSVVFDYSVGSVASFPVEPEGFVERGGELAYVQPEEDPAADAMYRSEVVVQRLGGGRFPVDVLLVFEDGHEVRHAWDGSERWKLFVEQRRSRLRHAVIDPERKLMLDPDYTNNSMLLESQAALPARKWASKWMIMLQDMLDTFAFYM